MTKDGINRKQGRLNSSSGDTGECSAAPLPIGMARRPGLIMNRLAKQGEGGMNK